MRNHDLCGFVWGQKAAAQKTVRSGMTRVIDRETTRSLNYKSGMSVTDYMGNAEAKDSIKESRVTVTQALSMVLMFGGILAVIVGASRFKWGADKISAAFYYYT